MGAFCSESGSKRSLFVAKTLLSGRYPQRRGSSLIPEGSAKGSDTCTKSGSGEDDTHTEGGGEEDGSDMLLTRMAAVVSTVAACTVFTRWKWK